MDFSNFEPGGPAVGSNGNGPGHEHDDEPNDDEPNGHEPNANASDDPNVADELDGEPARDEDAELATVSAAAKDVSAAAAADATAAAVDLVANVHDQHSLFECAGLFHFVFRYGLANTE